MHWDDLLVLFLTFKLDSLTLREWRTFLTGNELPSLKQLRFSNIPQGLASLPRRRSRQNRSQMLSGYRRARLPLNLNATSVKKNTSFIIAKTSWHFQYHKGPRKFAVANFASITCALLMHQVNAGHCKVCQAKHNKLHIPSAADPSTNNIDISIGCT